jgi:hypothetical protein
MEWDKVVKLILLNVIASFALLSHEAFFFFSLPALIIANAKPGSAGFPQQATAFVISLVQFMPSLLVFLLTTVFHGDASVAEAINASWRDLWASIEPEKCCFDEPRAAIAALQWDTSRAILLPASVLNDFSMGVYVPLAWLVTIFLCFFFMTRFVGTNDQGVISEKFPVTRERQRLARILIFQLAMISPLFIVGWDFGRWIFLWTISSLILFDYNVTTDIHFLKWPNKLAEWMLRQRWMNLRPRPWMLLFFGVPGCCWTVGSFFGSSPVGFFARRMTRIIAGY